MSTETTPTRAPLERLGAEDAGTVLRPAFVNYEREILGVLGKTREENTADQAVFVAETQRAGIDPHDAAVIYSANTVAAIKRARGAYEDETANQARIDQSNERARTRHGAEALQQANAFLDANPGFKALLDPAGAIQDDVVDVLVKSGRKG
jgi:hypothetical protein